MSRKTAEADDTNDTQQEKAEAPSLLEAITEGIDAADPQVDAEGEDDAAPAVQADGEDVGDDVADEAAGAKEKPAPKAEEKQDDKPKANADDEKAIAELGAKGKTAERLRETFARERTKDARIAELEPLAQAMTQWQDTLRSTKASAEDLGGALEILSHANAGTEDGARHALALIDNFRANLARRYGIDVAGVDHLSGFDDLKAAVEAGDITQDRAREVAALRLGQQQRQQAEKAQSAEAQFQTRVSTASAEVDALCAQLKASDPLYDAKFAVLRDVIPTLGATVAPEQWKPTFERMYQQVKIAAPPADTRRAGIEQPLRRESSGGGAKVPGSLQEAIAQAIGL